MSNRPRSYSTSIRGEICFGDEDLIRGRLTHPGPLLIRVTLNNRLDVFRVTVDPGTFVNVIFENAFQDILKKLPDNPVTRPSTIAFSDFSGNVMVPEKETDLLITIGRGVSRVEVLTTFVVCKGPSPYNMILGRSWLHRIKGVTSSVHECLKYVCNNDVFTLRSDEKNKAVCYYSKFHDNM